MISPERNSTVCYLSCRTAALLSDSWRVTAVSYNSIQFSFICTATSFNNRRCHKAALQKSGCRFKSLMRKTEVTDEIPFPDMTWWRRRKRNQKGTRLLLGDTGKREYEPFLFHCQLKQHWVCWNDVQDEHIVNKSPGMSPAALRYNFTLKQRWVSGMRFLGLSTKEESTVSLISERLGYRSALLS